MTYHIQIKNEIWPRGNGNALKSMTTHADRQGASSADVSCFKAVAMAETVDQKIWGSVVGYGIAIFRAFAARSRWKSTF
jgi:hypothetical protein